MVSGLASFQSLLISSRMLPCLDKLPETARDTRFFPVLIRPREGAPQCYTFRRRHQYAPPERHAPKFRAGESRSPERLLRRRRELRNRGPKPARPVARQEREHSDSLDVSRDMERNAPTPHASRTLQRLHCSGICWCRGAPAISTKRPQTRLRALLSASRSRSRRGGGQTGGAA